MPLSDRNAAKRRRSAGRSCSGARSPANFASWSMSTPYARRVFSDIPRPRSQPSKRARAAIHLRSCSMFVFWVNTEDGRVATYDQLDEAGLVENEKPVAPWHPIQGPSDASTMWYSVLRRETKGASRGTLCFRHTPRQASLKEAGWEEVPVEEIGP